jgi:hypothetical protein
MQLEIEFTIPRDERIGFLFQIVEEIVYCAARVDSRHLANCIRHASDSAEPLHVLPGWTTAAVAFAELSEVSNNVANLAQML